MGQGSPLWLWAVLGWKPAALCGMCRTKERQERHCVDVSQVPSVSFPSVSLAVLEFLDTKEETWGQQSSSLSIKTLG